MSGNTFGTLFQLTTFGESHGPALGGVVDGCPAGIPLSEAVIQTELDRRKPGQGGVAATARQEADAVRLLSGVFEGLTTGTPIGFVIENQDQRSRDYSKIMDVYRPGHADLTFDAKFGRRDYRGGGRSSGRETVSRVAGGAIALGQEDIKKLVAYSSVDNKGFVTLGIFLFNLRGVEGALFQMLNHGIITGALFMMIGCVYERSHSRQIVDNMGLGKYMPAFMGFWGLYALASFGFPGTNGFVGEMLVFTGAFQSSPYIGALIVPGALLGAAYKMAWGQPATAKTWKDLNTREWAYLLIPAAFVFYIGLAPGLFFRLIDPSVEKLVSDFKQRNTVEQKVAAQPAPPAVAAVVVPAEPVNN